MSSNRVICADGVGKAYAIFAKPEDRLKQMLLGRWRTYYEHFWALKKIDLEICKGETWGIIGRNGSGKSTLLQIICGNLSPTIGSVTVHGRIAALLELGAGFNPEFTGRENVYINGIIAGHDRHSVDQRLDDILAFADIGAFIDQPVKIYSSGMFARLAFAVAINIDPDILVIDEALAVGDEAFQRKCFAHMERIKNDGATILFVSHASTSVIDLCDHAILLHEGEHLYSGQPKRTVAWYQKLVDAPAPAAAKILSDIRSETLLAGMTHQGDSSVASRPAVGESQDAQQAAFSAADDDSETDYFDPNLISKSITSYAPNGALITDAGLYTLDGRQVNCLLPGERYEFRNRVTFAAAADHVKFYCMVKMLNGTHLGGGVLPEASHSSQAFASDDVIDVKFEFGCAFGHGTYFFNCGVAAGGELLHRVLDVLAFRVLRGAARHSMGAVDLNVEATFEQVNEFSQRTMSQ